MSAGCPGVRAGTVGDMNGTGQDSRGCIEREGSLGHVQPDFLAVVAAVRERLPRVFGRRLHSAYLYGSVPRGDARPGRSDLDVLLARYDEPTDGDRAAAAKLGAGAFSP